MFQTENALGELTPYAYNTTLNGYTADGDHPWSVPGGAQPDRQVSDRFGLMVSRLKLGSRAR